MMMLKRMRAAALLAAVMCVSLTAPAVGTMASAASQEEASQEEALPAGQDLPDMEYASGGGYAATGQIEGVGYTAVLYDATNGLPTSDANYIAGSSDGYVWIGGYSGIIRYDGNNFVRQDSSGGLTSGRAIFEDSRGRLWFGTNDNGAVMVDGRESRHFTSEDGLPSSSMRTFAEGNDGSIYMGCTAGICYVDAGGVVRLLDDERLYNDTIDRLVSDSEGIVYGTTRSGVLFSIDAGRVSELISKDETGFSGIQTIYADPWNPGMIYLGTAEDGIYYGKFGEPAESWSKTETAPYENINWITSACGRIWAAGDGFAGFIGEDGSFHVLEDIPLDNTIEMLTADYQGNIWMASSRQGVVKVVTNNFRDITGSAGLDTGTVNSTCLSGGILYVGTDNGLYLLDRDGEPLENELTDYLGTARIRCVMEDSQGNVWISVYTDGLGLVCMYEDGRIVSFTEENGMPGSQIRCTIEAKDGSVLAATNDGLAVIKDGQVIRTVTASDEINNTVFLTLEEGPDGEIYIGTDGDGIYILEGDTVRKLGRENGLSSDVILRIKWDEKRNVFWIITSNSIEYIKDGELIPVDTFPYNNNFDIFSDSSDNIWILSSYGIFCVEAQDMLDNIIEDYRVYTLANGLPGASTANSFSELDEEGNLYISERTGVALVNIDNFYDQSAKIRLGVESVLCNSGEIWPDENGLYTLPSDAGRIQINPAVLDFTMSNPLVRVYLEGAEDEGIVMEQSSLKTLEYTGLRYGDYVLHVQILNKTTGELFQEAAFDFYKEPRLLELLPVQFMLLALLVLLAAVIVWRVMKGTIIRKQYTEILQARDEAERANSTRSRFLANMSHEIRTPLNVISGMDEMILREDASKVPDEYRSAVVSHALDIKKASESLQVFINNLFDMSSIESGKMQLKEHEYDTAAMLQSLVSITRIRTREKELFFDLDIDEMLPARLYGDVEKIRQIMINLLSNAVKFTSIGGLTLKVSLMGRSDDLCEIRFSVKDTGMGMSEKELKTVLDDTDMADEERTDEEKRTGLGLDIARRFAKLMDGELTAESEYGKGSEFIFSLKQKIINGSPVGTFIEQASDNWGRSFAPGFVAPDADVLVADENEENLAIIRGLLKPTKIFVSTAESPEECMEKLSETAFNLVLVSSTMRGARGDELIRQIRERYPDIPVYAMTADAMAWDEEYKEKGYNGCLITPVESRALENTVLRHLPEAMIMRLDGQKKEINANV